MTVQRWTLASLKLSVLCYCTLDSLLLQHTEKKGKTTERLRQIFQVVSVNKYNYKKVFRVVESSRTSCMVAMFIVFRTVTIKSDEAI